MNRQTIPRPWFWLHVFLAWFTLAWTVATAIMGNPPPPILLLLGIIQALIFQWEWEKSSREEAEK
jgi:Na+/H+ antiporter NhaC